MKSEWRSARPIQKFPATPLRSIIFSSSAGGKPSSSIFSFPFSPVRRASANRLSPP
jgi:hypothetical protein